MFVVAVTGKEWYIHQIGLYIDEVVAADISAAIGRPFGTWEEWRRRRFQSGGKPRADPGRLIYQRVLTRMPLVVNAAMLALVLVNASEKREWPFWIAFTGASWWSWALYRHTSQTMGLLDALWRERLTRKPAAASESTMHNTERLAGLLREIQSFVDQQIYIVIFVFFVALALIALAEYGKLDRAFILVPPIIVAGAFALARNDLLMHRAGQYVRILEEQQAAAAGGKQEDTWEKWKQRQWSTRILLPALDVAVLGSLLLPLFIYAETRTWTYLSAVSSTWAWAFAISTCVLLLAAVVSIVVAIQSTR